MIGEYRIKERQRIQAAAILEDTDKMKIYLDTCCYNRKFDQQTQGIVKLETDAINLILQGVIKDKHSLVWSETLDREISQIEDEEKRAAIQQWQDIAAENVKTTDAIIKSADDLMTHGLKQMDARHAAATLAANCDYLITVDKKLLNRAKEQGIPALNPLEFTAITKED